MIAKFVKDEIRKLILANIDDKQEDWMEYAPHQPRKWRDDNAKVLKEMVGSLLHCREFSNKCYSLQMTPSFKTQSDPSSLDCFGLLILLCNFLFLLSFLLCSVYRER